MGLILGELGHHAPFALLAAVTGIGYVGSVGIATLSDWVLPPGPIAITGQD